MKKKIALKKNHQVAPGSFIIKEAMKGMGVPGWALKRLLTSGSINEHSL